MPIREIRATNFKSFRNLLLLPSAFNVVIGSNASGKSNFIQIIKFIRDIAKYGLPNAISLQGGVEFLRNTRIGPAEDLTLQIVYDLERPRREVIGLAGSVQIEFLPSSIEYGFRLAFSPGDLGYTIQEDALRVEGKFSWAGNSGEIQAGEGALRFWRGESRIQCAVDEPAGSGLSDEQFFLCIQREPDIHDGQLIMNIPLALPGIPALEWIFRGMKVYDFDPRLLKQSVPLAGKRELEKDGSNLPLVVRAILDDPRKKNLLSSLLQDILPFVNGISVEKAMDRSLILMIREIYHKDHAFPGLFLSDGTINIIALIIALYFEDRPVTIIEEPERNIHPNLIKRLVSMLMDASRNKQILVTTHNPEMVRHVALEDILLISRDRDGFSAISRPATKAEIRRFLEDEIGIEELFIQNLLGIE